MKTSCMPIHESASRIALRDAKSVVAEFLKAPNLKDVSFEQDFSRDVLAALSQQERKSTLVYALQPYQRLESLVRPLRGKAFIIQ